MLRKIPDPDQTDPRGDRRDLGTGARWTLWALTAADIMVVVWMTVMGEWLDSASPVTSVITLGGHHRVVFGIALAGFLLLAALAPLTQGFASASPWQLVLLPLAGVTSVVALAGLLSVGGLAVITILLIAHLFGAPPTRIDVRRR
jgi:hypothetical protein